MNFQHVHVLTLNIKSRGTSTSTELKIKTFTYLRPGDTVDVIAPASYSELHKLQQGCQWLKSIGLIPRVPPGMVRPDAYFAAPLQAQLEQIKDAVHSDSKAIWCLRGGYGSMRLIPELLKMKVPKNKKIFLGFSDITALHLFFTQAWNWPTIHGRNICQMSKELSRHPDRRLLKDILFGTVRSKLYSNLVPLNASAREVSRLTGKLTGGNLRILQSSVKTGWELRARNKILFLEDVSERGYSVDRMLEQMIQARLIHKGLKAIVFGEFTEGLEIDGKDLTPLVLKRFAQQVEYPVLRGLPCGHGLRWNYPLPFNTQCELVTGPRGQLRCSF
ncbi:MAG TPA: LD-carboxypeptidase [Bacteriovoracaceae bacterium]|nr:LD-carboxypeptidase [Bacteriovoracaceae bacterium]